MKFETFETLKLKRIYQKLLVFGKHLLIDRVSHLEMNFLPSLLSTWKCVTTDLEIFHVLLLWETLTFIRGAVGCELNGHCSHLAILPEQLYQSEV